MQNENESPDDENNKNAPPPTHSSPEESNYIPFPSPPSQIHGNFNHSLIFPPNSVSFPATPSSSELDNSLATETRLYQARLILENQQLRDRYDLCRIYLRDILNESESLRIQNADLRLANQELTNKLSLLISQRSLLEDFRRLTLGRHVSSASGLISPTSVIETNNNNNNNDKNNNDNNNNNNNILPKCISVRSNGYRLANQPSQSPSRQRVPSPSPLNVNRVCVARRSEEEDEMELEVYNQGMVKTELCNKWQETGACPYGENCQFAHGINELRPVIRHPRYKTQVCRMVLAGGLCPYAHRCHFRHALTDQERLVRSLSLR